MAEIVDTRDAIQFLQEMIRIDSTNPPGHEHRVTEWLARRFERIHLPFQVMQIEDGRSNLEVRLTGTGRKKLFFCGHMDTVATGDWTAWTYPPFSGELVDNRLYGRGASDMKSGLAAMVLAIESLYRDAMKLDGDVILLATAGEEVDSCGARRYREEIGVDDVDAIVIGEPTHEKVVIGHKGALWLEVTCFGKTAHGSMPDQGINAIEHMIQFIEQLKIYEHEWRKEERILGKSSITVTQMHGGIQTNVIPDRCVIHLDIRSVPPQSHLDLIREIKQKAEALSKEINGFRAEVRMLLDRAPILSSTSSDIIQTALQIKGLSEDDVYGVSYYTDGSVLNPQSTIPTLIYGPGDEKLAHQPNEWVDVDAYIRSISFYRELAIQYLGRGMNFPHLR
ncbi:M20 family metallopeptidase [Thermoflavimicrobium dichotomicum]|uniref:Succinyl-diaminopimelate desuccinylase n=1 Tax=Thermoflavimicrobium dichotomicum TaxID=46223 RepID=A0A1I3TYM0_9BACL|nr:M20 family metallopeptidase [Thermoflavimicrobium dichotomicum]SFJ75583.1 succinyl-diaminopimelate desuccinylase [Thermoflavimicrobium dichotomicum]